MSIRESNPGHHQLEAWLGPERVALALTILVGITLALLLRLGPFSAGPQPSSSPGPAPGSTGSTPALMVNEIGARADA